MKGGEDTIGIILIKSMYDLIFIWWQVSGQHLWYSKHPHIRT